MVLLCKVWVYDFYMCVIYMIFLNENVIVLKTVVVTQNHIKDNLTAIVLNFTFTMCFQFRFPLSSAVKLVKSYCKSHLQIIINTSYK